MARALIVLPSEAFSESEYNIVREKLEADGNEVKTASSHEEAFATGDLAVEVDLELDEIKPENFDIFVFIGGLGSREYWQNPTVQRIAAKAIQDGKVVAAGRSATMILANAGLLQGKRVTGPTPLAEPLRNQGADYTTHEVAEDQNIITLRRHEGLKPYANILAERAKRKKAA